MPIKLEDHQLRFNQPNICLPGQNILDDYEPTGEIHPVDEICQKLVRVIGRKGWDLPDIDVAVRTYGDAENPLMTVQSISGGTKGNKWRVNFGRADYANEKWNIVSAANTITIPKQQFDVGGHLYLYAGDDWENDEDLFMNGSKVNSKLKNKKKLYLVYEGQRHQGPIIGKMYHTNDIGREYDPDLSKGELKEITKAEIFKKSIDFLTKIAEDIEKTYPNHVTLPITRLRQLAKIDIVPVPEKMPVLIVSERPDSNPEILVAGNGWRFYNYDIPNNPSDPYPEKLYDGFSYGFASAPYKFTSWHGFNDPRSTDNRIMKVRLNKANDIYVVDEAIYEDLREKFTQAAEAEKRDRFKEAELSEIYGNFAKTLISLKDYQFNYQKPVFLINRPLAGDEAEDITDLVRHPNPENQWDPILDFGPAFE